MRRPNILLIFIICLFVVIEILFLRPSTVPKTEESHSMFSSIETLVEAQKQKDEIGYTINGFHYTAVEGEVKHWEIFAKQAVLYENSKMVLAHDAIINMFDGTGKTTNIKGDQAYYRMGQRDLDLEGNVKVLFPDGFWVTTSRAHYTAATEQITSDRDFNGQAAPQKGELMHIWGTGFSATKSGPEIHIHKNTHAKLRRLANDEITDVNSDKALVNRETKTSYFSMNDPLKKYVETVQGTLFIKSRRQEASYDPADSALEYMTAYDDVYIREMDEKRRKNGLKYATCQKADFLTQQDKILLSGFPSAYQENDILTGEQIIIHRKKNLVEVTQTNAFHQGRSSEASDHERKK